MVEDREIHVPGCFGCGGTNPIGLKLDFTVDGDRATAEFTSTEHHVGPPGIVHGGVIAAIIDEALSFVCRSLLNHPLRTVKQEITFRNSSRIGETICVEACIEKEKSRAVVATARVYSGERTIAEGKGTLFKVKEPVLADEERGQGR